MEKPAGNPKPVADKSFDEVLRAEADEIKERRGIAVTEAPGSDSSELNSVGVALSGGGIRSAIFNLGLLQAFSHRGLLRFVDYISSVSGGGYIAGYLATQTPTDANGKPQNFHESKLANLGVNPQTGKHNIEMPGRSSVGDGKTAAPQTEKHNVTGNSEGSYRFRGSADYLSDLIGWGWRYVASTSLMLALFWSGLIAIGAFLALLWRTLDYQEVRSYLAAINLSDFGNELTIAFLPCALLIAVTGLGVLFRVASTCGNGLFGTMIVLSLLSGLLGSVLAALGRVLAIWDAGWPIWNGFSAEEWYVLMPFAVMGLLSCLLLVARGLTRTRWHKWRSIPSPVLWMFWFLPSLGLAIAIIVGMWNRHGDGVAHSVRICVLLLVIALQTAYWCLMRADSPTKFERRFDTVLWWLAAIVLVTAIISVAVFMGNGEATISPLHANLQLNHFVTWLSAAVLFLQLVPLLGLDRLLRSNREESPIWQKRFFTSIVGAALFAPAFFVVHWMARENISEYADYRDPELHRNDVLQWPAFIDVLDRWNQRIPAVPGNASQIDELGDLKPALEKLLENHKDPLLDSHRELWEAERSTRGAPEWERRENRPFGTWTGTARSAGLAGQHLLGLDDRSVGTVPMSLTVYRERWENHQRNRQSFVEQFNQDILKKPGLTHLLLREVVLRAGKLTKLPDPSQTPSVKQPKPAMLPAIRAADVESAAVAEYVETLRQQMAKDDPNQAAQFKTNWDRLARADLPGIPGGESLPTFDSTHWQSEEIAQFNRLLLVALYPNLIRSRTMVSTLIVTHRDQVVRILWFVGGCSIFLSLLFCVDFNHNSPFYWFYWRRLKRFFLNKNVDAQAGDQPEPPLLLAELNTCQHGMPYFLFAGTLMLRRKRRDKPEGANQLFLFSKHYCGTKEVGYRKTGDYQVYDEHPAGEPDPLNGKGRLRLTDAMTISGSAITPYMVGNRTWLSILMTAFNLRLGQWLPNPNPEAARQGNGEPPGRLRRALSAIRRLFPAVSAGTAAREYLRSFQSNNDRDWHYGFVADGGYRDFLGVEDLLRRRCRLIICSDAGFNTGPNEFGSLAAMVRMARLEEGIEFLDLDHDQPVNIDRFRHDAKAENRVPQQILCMRILYPANEEGKRPEGLLFYVQMALTGREDVDLQQFRHRNPQFPEEPTTNQNFTADQVESYRQLGAHIGAILCRELPPHHDAPEKWRRKTGLDQTSYEDLLKDIERRLLLGYQWECLREVAYHREDVYPETLFAAGADLRLPEDAESDPFGMAGEEPAEEWLRRYGGDADFRNFYRRRILRLLVEPDRPPSQNLPPAGQLAVTIVALHELRAKPEGQGTSKDGDVKRMGDEVPRLFQVGGRERLLRACESFREKIDELWKGDVILEFRQGLEDPRRELVKEIASTVFRTGGPDTALALLTKGLCEWCIPFTPQDGEAETWLD